MANTIPWRRSTDPESPTFEPAALIRFDGKDYYVHLAVATRWMDLERENAELREACETFVAWLRQEDAGPQYPAGINRDTPGGESIWRAWWESNLELCELAQTRANAALRDTK